jgi:uncharacterized protein YwqG
MHHLGLGQALPYLERNDAWMAEELEGFRQTSAAWAKEHARQLETLAWPQLRAWRQRREEVERRAAGFRTLLLLESAADVEWSWGDAGTLELLIDGDDLRSKQFDRTYLRLCSG